MLNEIFSLIIEYRLVVMGAILLILFTVVAKKKRGSKKVLLTISAVLAMSIIYEMVAHEPATRIPLRINEFLNQPGPTESTNTHYYVSPEKRIKIALH